MRATKRKREYEPGARGCHPAGNLPSLTSWDCVVVQIALRLGANRDPTEGPTQHALGACLPEGAVHGARVDGCLSRNRYASDRRGRVGRRGIAVGCGIVACRRGAIPVHDHAVLDDLKADRQRVAGQRVDAMGVHARLRLSRGSSRGHAIVTLTAGHGCGRVGGRNAGKRGAPRRLAHRASTQHREGGEAAGERDGHEI